MKIYTKMGDGGKTRLATGEQVSKSSDRIEAYGTVDELNAVVGLVRDSLKLHLPNCIPNFDLQLKTIQYRLFELGSELAMPGKLDKMIQVITDRNVEELEKSMDEMTQSLPPLKNFVLPGGHIVNSYFHLARTICRRSERQVVRMRKTGEEVRPEVAKFLNRLSDWFFVASRKIMVEADVEEVLWD